MTELLNCPFCGAKARVKHLITAGVRTHSRIECINCHVKTDYYVHEFGEPNLIAVWNTRAERTCQQVDVTKEYQPYVTHRTACSLCGETLALEEFLAPNYCPNCGAKVVEE